MSTIWYPGTLEIHIWCMFDLVVCRSHFEAIQCTCLTCKMACKSEMAGHKVKRNIICDPGTICGTFALVVLKIIFGSSSGLVSKWIDTFVPKVSVWDTFT